MSSRIWRDVKPCQYRCSKTSACLAESRSIERYRRRRPRTPLIHSRQRFRVTVASQVVNLHVPPTPTPRNCRSRRQSSACKRAHTCAYMSMRSSGSTVNLRMQPRMKPEYSRRKPSQLFPGSARPRSVALPRPAPLSPNFRLPPEDAQHRLEFGPLLRLQPRRLQGLDGLRTRLSGRKTKNHRDF